MSKIKIKTNSKSIKKTDKIQKDLRLIRDNSICIPDRILNYMNYGLKKLNLNLNTHRFKRLDEWYKSVRLEIAEKGMIEIKIIDDFPDSYYSEVFQKWIHPECYTKSTQNPITIAACLVYIFCLHFDLEPRQEKISAVFEISQATLRNNWRIIKSFLEEQKLL